MVFSLKKRLNKASVPDGLFGRNASGLRLCCLTGKYGDLRFCGDYCTGVLHLDDIRIIL
jgi:hypothetical protein